MQILPAIDLRGGQAVRLRQGDYDRETVFDADPVAVAKSFAEAGADWLHLVDLDGAKEGSPVNEPVVREIVAAVKPSGVPCELGGGVRDRATIERLLDTGLERLIVGTKAVTDPEWFESMCREFPGRLVLGVDAKASRVATAGWLDVSERTVTDLVKQYEALPLAAIIYTNIANDGMMQGVDGGTIEQLRGLAEFGHSVVASGGVTTADDVRAICRAAADRPNLDGIIIGRALYEGTLSVAEAVAIARAAGAGGQA